MCTQAIEQTVKGTKPSAMSFTLINVAGKLTQPVRTIEAKDRHKHLVIAKRLYTESAWTWPATKTEQGATA